MITIEVKNVKSIIDKHLPLLEEKLAIFHPKYWHTTKWKDGVWDGKTHFLNLSTGKFPTGHLHIVQEFLKAEGLEYQLVYEQKNPVDEVDLSIIQPRMLQGITLRKDQLEAIEQAILLEKGVIQMPTGTGKTEVAIAITEVLKLKTLFLVNSKSLLYQTQERFIARLGCSEYEVGILGDGVHAPGSQITIATVQSLDSMKKGNINFIGSRYFSRFMRDHKIIMFDECHHASAKTWYTVGTWAHEAYYRYGFSGTPMDRDEIDAMELMAVTGQTIYKRKTQDAINDGDLCKIEMEILPNTEVVYGKNWQEVYNKGIVDSVKRNILICNEAIKHFHNKDKVLILVRHIEHGDNLHRMLESYPIYFLHGKHSQKERKAIICWFTKPGGKILIASGIFDEGIDIPEINALIVASGGKSDVKTIQRIGRGLRKKPGNIFLNAYDFADASQYLYEHSLRRKKIYEREGYV